MSAALSKDEVHSKGTITTKRSNAETGGMETAVAIRAEDEGNPVKKIRFRNYKPSDDSLSSSNKQGELPSDLNKIRQKESLSPKSNTGIKEIQRDSLDNDRRNNEPIAAALQEQAADAVKRELASLQSDVIHVVPKKANWDIKAMVQGRLEKLKRRTKIAIVEILRQKLAEQKDEDDGEDGDGNTN